MNEYKDNKEFLRFLELMQVDINKTDEKDLVFLYELYQTNVNNFIKNVNSIYDSMSDTLKTNEDKNNSLFEEVLATNLDEISDEDLRDLSIKVQSQGFIKDVVGKKADEVYKKTHDFFKRNKMELYELEIDNDKSGGQYAKETWVHRKTGYSMLTAYPIIPDTYSKLDSNMKKNIINKQQELGIQIFDFQIKSLDKIDQTKYYTHLLEESIKEENYELSAKYRDILKKLEKAK